MEHCEGESGSHRCLQEGHCVDIDQQVQSMDFPKKRSRGWCDDSRVKERGHRRGGAKVTLEAKSPRECLGIRGESVTLSGHTRHLMYDFSAWKSDHRRSGS